MKRKTTPDKTEPSLYYLAVHNKAIYVSYHGNVKSDRVRSNICLQLSSCGRADYYSSYIQKIIEKEGYVPFIN